MQIRSYPDKDYTCDGKVQRTVSQHAVFRERVFRRFILGIIGSFASIFVCGFLGIDLLVWILMGFAGTAFVVVLALISYTPRPACPRCRSRMQRRYIKRKQGPGGDLFLICAACKIDADAHHSRE